MFAALPAMLGVGLALIGVYAAQESWGEFNEPQVAVSWLASLALAATAAIVYGLASGRAWGKALAVALAVDGLLIAAWIIGQLTWCSHCGGA